MPSTFYPSNIQNLFFFFLRLSLRRKIESDLVMLFLLYFLFFLKNRDRPINRSTLVGRRTNWAYYPECSWERCLFALIIGKKEMPYTQTAVQLSTLVVPWAAFKLTIFGLSLYARIASIQAGAISPITDTVSSWWVRFATWSYLISYSPLPGGQVCLKPTQKPGGQRRLCGERERKKDWGSPLWVAKEQRDFVPE